MFFWHSKNFKRLDYLAVVFLPNFIFPLISAKELETFFFSSKELDFQCMTLKI